MFQKIQTFPDFNPHFQFIPDKQFEQEKLQNQLDNLNSKLSNCGKIATINFYCRKDPQHEHLIKTEKRVFHCEIRFCDKIDCIVDRFASQVEEFNSIKRLQGLNSLWHFTLGFPKISKFDLDNNFRNIKKKHEKLMYNFFLKLKQLGLHLQGVRVLDFSLVNGIYPHYHFGVIPLKSGEYRRALILMKSLAISMSSVKLGDSFVFESYGYKNKQSIFSYLAKRSAGLYKFDEAKNHDWNSGKGRLVKDIQAGNYFTLSQFISSECYIKNFYKGRHYVTFGGLPHGSILTDNSSSSIPNFCHIHGELTRKDVRVEIIFEENTPPPVCTFQTYPEQPIEVIHIR